MVMKFVWIVIGLAAAGPLRAQEGVLSDVVVKEQESKLVFSDKPHLDLKADPFASIRKSLEPEDALLLADPPQAVTWKKTYSEFLNSLLVIRPGGVALSQRPRLVFHPRDELDRLVRRSVDDKDRNRYKWSLSIADADGNIFQRFDGAGNMPEQVLWNGQNEKKDWLQAGQSYSPVYAFTDPFGMSYTGVGKALKFRGIVHEEDQKMVIVLDSSVLFGQDKRRQSLDDGEGLELLRSVADFVKRFYYRVPMNLRIYASDEALAMTQAKAFVHYFTAELLAKENEISSQAFKAPYLSQRVEVVLEQGKK